MSLQGSFEDKLMSSKTLLSKGSSKDIAFKDIIKTQRHSKDPYKDITKTLKRPLTYSRFKRPLHLKNKTLYNLYIKNIYISL